MIEIYAPYLYLIMFACLVIGSLAGYLLCGSFVEGERVDVSGYENLLKEEIRLRKLAEKELAEEQQRCKLLEESNQAILYDREQSFKETFAEMHKDHKKILIDVKDNKAKIPETKHFKRRKLGKRSA